MKRFWFVVLMWTALDAAPHDLDLFSRSAPARNFFDHEVLDIPAFLRRKAS